MIRLLLLWLFVLPIAVWADNLPPAEAEYPELDMNEVRLGQLLFYDPVLSGNKTLSCATCHHPRFGTSDGVSLGIGDGGMGLGPERRADPENPPEQRIPRNAPALFNLGSSEFTSFFHDGRLEVDLSGPTGMRTPLGPEMEAGFASALAAQAMFPVLSGDEMAGHYSENEVAQAVRQGFLTGKNGAWAKLSGRIEAIDAYREGFDTAIGAGNAITFADIANVIAAFIIFEWRADDSPFDRYLKHGTLLPASAKAGMALFYGKAGCSNCHSGLFQTDHGLHAIAMPQIGPGKAARFERHNRDVGRMRVTGRAEDAYRFRTPSLRNVTATAPYGHSGAYRTLEGVIRHHLNPVRALKSYDLSRAILPGVPFDSDDAILRDQDEILAIAEANELEVINLSDREVEELIAFLSTLADPTSLKGRLGVPDAVPSGLPVDR